MVFLLGSNKGMVRFYNLLCVLHGHVSSIMESNDQLRYIAQTGLKKRRNEGRKGENNWRERCCKVGTVEFNGLCGHINRVRYRV